MGEGVARHDSARRRSLAAVLALVMVAGLPGAAAAVVNDMPVGGGVLKLRASQNNPSGRRMVFRSAVDPAIGTPFADPASGAALLVHASNAAGQCRVEVALPVGNWSAIRGDGPNNGWRYLDPGASAGGIFKIVLKRRRGGGVIVVKAKGGGFPCGLEAGAQQQPISVVLRVGDERYCASFGGTVLDNGTGAFKAKNAAPPATCPDADLTVANLNVLHGLFCPAPTANCRLQDRLDLLGQWIAARGCPDAVALQEVHDVNPSLTMIPLIEATLLDVCDPPYEVIYIRDNTFDDSLILSRYPALETELIELYIGFRNVLRARLDHPIGPVDLFSTHLASGSDGGSNACGTGQPCPQECIDAGAVTVRDCQAVQLGLFVDSAHDVDAPAIVMGDFNRQPGTFIYNQMVDRGWPDTYLAAGNPECVPATGVGCTSGREDQDVTDLESTALNVDSRIDYVFLVPPGPASTCSATLDSPTDDDADGTATRLFAADPNPFSASCGPSPDPICWVSDHSGVEADVNCE
jgi:endonuclease/exonuclease/phosphatase family metal-dependent hydrolase